MNRIAVVLGTRPEAIKLAPLVRALRNRTGIEVSILFTGQHRAMGEEALTLMRLTPDEDLNLMTENQEPAEFLGAALDRLSRKLAEALPAAVIVQGDTTTALAGSLAGFHLRTPVIHLEAGLRSFDFSQPFPEEMNRVCISRISSLHLCPTRGAAENLGGEGISKNVHVTGNTVVDSLQWVEEEMRAGRVTPSDVAISIEAKKRPYLFVTAHRRESFGRGIEQLCHVLRSVVAEHKGIDVVFPVHLNPNVQEPVHALLGGTERVHLLAPLDYASTIFLLKHSKLIITDSGGIQEEAPALGKRVLVTRKITERPEVIESGFGALLTLEDHSAALEQIRNELADEKVLPPVNPFGDGEAGERSAGIICEMLGEL